MGDGQRMRTNRLQRIQENGESKGIFTGSTGALAFGVRACNIGVRLGFSKLASAHPKAYEAKHAEILNTHVMLSSLFCEDSAYLHCWPALPAWPRLNGAVQASQKQ